MLFFLFLFCWTHGINQGRETIAETYSSDFVLAV